MKRRDFLNTNSIVGLGVLIAPSILLEKEKIGYFKIQSPQVCVDYIENGEKLQRYLLACSWNCKSFGEWLERKKDWTMFVYDVYEHPSYGTVVRAAIFDIDPKSVINGEFHYDTDFKSIHGNAINR